MTEDLAGEEYPLTREEVLDRYGDRELEHAGGTTTVREVLGTEGQDDFDEPEAVHQEILNMVGTEAVGRDRYSDRGGSTPVEQEEEPGEIQDDQESV